MGTHRHWAGVAVGSTLELAQHHEVLPQGNLIKHARVQVGILLQGKSERAIRSMRRWVDYCNWAVSCAETRSAL